MEFDISYSVFFFGPRQNQEIGKKDCKIRTALTGTETITGYKFFSAK